MEPEPPPPLLHRVRWGNVAWAVAALLALALAVAWPHMQPHDPRFPDQAHTSVPPALAPGGECEIPA